MSKQGMIMSRRAFMGAAAASGIVLAACGSSGSGDDSAAPAVNDITGTYDIHIQGYDWGPGVDKAYLTLSAPLDAVEASTFVVTETKQVTDWSDETYPVVEATLDRQVTGARLIDADGNETSEPSNRVEIDLLCSPADGSPLLFTMATQYNTWSDPYYLTITISDEAALTSNGTEVASLTVDEACTAKTSSAEVFEKAEFTASDGTTYEYACYAPEGGSKALLVWLHGMGEGGSKVTGASDPDVTVLGGKVTALAGEELQEKVAINVLAPQCPTVWSDTDGNQGNVANGAVDITDDCFWRESLAELIDTYAQQVGAEKIVIAGCSAGGYMTMNMAVHYLDKYAAYVPICEAYHDEFMSDEQIAELAKVPLFFIQSADDPVVAPDGNWVPTLRRLADANPVDLHSFTSEKVVDVTGEVTDENGDPYQYNGHFSWVYFHNNDAICDECGIPVFDWIAEQVA